MIRFVAVLIFVSVWFSAFALAADWPMYGSDSERSHTTSESLDFPLAKIWKYTPAQPPHPAWQEPGKELHRIDFDYAPQPVIAQGIVYFGSSSDDTLRAMTLATGALKWAVTVGGPIRFSPVCAVGKVFVVSDDGYLYCFDAEDGSLVWKFRGAPFDGLLLGNGRMISRWPLRSGLVIKDEIVYFTAGMWPAHGVFLYAIAADTGKELWRNDSSGELHISLPHRNASAFSGVAPQGSILVSNDSILVPTGRSVPAVYDRKTGKLRYYLPSENKRNGGAWASIANGLFFNQSHESTKGLNAYIGEAKPRLSDGICVYELSSGKNIMKIQGKLRSVIADGIMYAAGSENLVALDLQCLKDPKKMDKYVKWSVARKSRSYSLVGAKRSIIVGGSSSIIATDKATGKELWKAYINGQARGLAVSDGRLLVATEKGVVTCFGSVSVAVPVIPVKKRLTWDLGVDDVDVQLAEQIISKTGVKEGYALVLGEDDTSLAASIAMQSKLHVIAILNDSEMVQVERERLLTSDLYGQRITVCEMSNSNELPFASYFASLVVVSKNTAISGLYRILRPYGGTLCFPGVKKRETRNIMRNSGAERSEFRTLEGMQMIVRGALPDSGEWRQQWADSGNSGIGQERGIHPPFDLLWFGGLGPDRMMDRHWASAAPLFVGGRVFVTGQNHVIAFNAYDGRELWSRYIEGAGRRHIPYYASNFIADDASVYLAIGALCLRLDQKTGNTLTTYHLPYELERGKAAKLSTTVQYDIAIIWPKEWKVLGPFASPHQLLSANELASIPAKARNLPCLNGVLDFTYLYGGYGFKPLASGAKPVVPRGPGRRKRKSANRVAYAFSRINVAKDGLLTIGAGVDREMQWFLDGVSVSDTFKKGDNANGPSIRDHVFSVTITKGSHLLSVMVKSGTTGWSLVSAGGQSYLPHLKFLRQYEERPVWGYLAASDDFVLGTYVGIDNSEADSSALFALNKRNGSVRWVKRAERSFASDAIAFTKNRVFALDSTAQQKVRRSKWKKNELLIEQTLLGLDLDTGKELWRQDDVPSEQSRVQYSAGIVTINANAGYSAVTGKKIWQHQFNPLSPPIIHGDTIIAEPYAYDLRTGLQKKVRHPISGESMSWLLARSYGCGLITGCESFLCFRSAAPGVYDFAQGGITTFGGIRPGCAANMMPAGGLLTIPEASSGCSCSYNLQTSLALISSSRKNQPWYVFSASENAEPLQQLRVNFGAQGDRRDKKAQAWFGYPRPITPNSCPLPIDIDVSKVMNYVHRSQRTPIIGTDQQWLYTSEIINPRKINVFLIPPLPVMQIAEQPPVLDGLLDEKCWKDAQPIVFPREINLKEPATTFLICRDSANVYIGYNRKLIIRNGQPLPLKIKEKKDAPSYREDSFFVLLSDNELRSSVELELTCNGTYRLRRHILPDGRIDRKWYGQCSQAVRTGEGTWSAEVAIPIATLRTAGIEPDTLRINLKSQNQTGVGLSKIELRDPAPASFSYTRTFAPLSKGLSKFSEQQYSVTLYFAEPEQVTIGARVFDVRIQGELLLKNFDIMKEAGGRNKALVKQFKKINAGSVLTIEFKSSNDHIKSYLPPLLNALEITKTE